MACSVLSYACCVGDSQSTDDFWDRLVQGHATSSFTFDVPFDPQNEHQALDLLTQKLLRAFTELRSDHAGTAALVHESKLGVILASTKGCVDDYIWDEARFEAHRANDPLTPVLRSFLRAASLRPALSLCISNACASSLSALFLADKWLAQHRVEQVLVLACDRVGPFVEKGFASLQALSATIPRPFDAQRDGLRLGEAAAAVLVGNLAGTQLAKQTDRSICIRSIGIDTEGYALTRPSPSGESIKRACAAMRRHQGALREPGQPDLIVAHGTATSINDSTEDAAFYELFGTGVPITGTKWLAGHTLGASGLVDLIAACKAIATQRAFHLATTQQIDPCLRGSYLGATTAVSESFPIRTIVQSSLGFGGVHAMAEIGIGDPS